MSTKVIRFTGWTLISIGVFLLLFVVYLLWFTGLSTHRAQGDLLDQWNLEVGTIDGLPGEDQGGAGDFDPVAAGDAYAALWFERGGERIGTLADDASPLFVVEGSTLDHLRRGPGHYRESSAPGEGNLAIAGHRTTYGAPFYDLDRLLPGDEIHVVDRTGVQWTYRMREQRIVTPEDVWVVGRDPLGWDVPMLTLTTCHPRFSSSQRMVIFAELVTAAEVFTEEVEA